MTSFRLTMIAAGFAACAQGGVITFATIIQGAPCAPVTSNTSSGEVVSQVTTADCVGFGLERTPRARAEADLVGPGLSVFAEAISSRFDNGNQDTFVDARVIATQTYSVMGGLGAMLLLDYSIRCVGNQASFVTPVLQVFDGSTTQTTPGLSCGGVPRTGTLFQSITSLDHRFTITMDTSPTLQSFGFELMGYRELTVTARILDANGFDVQGVSLVAVPEPGTLLPFGLGLGALLLRRQQTS